MNFIRIFGLKKYFLFNERAKHSKYNTCNNDFNVSLTLIQRKLFVYKRMSTACTRKAELTSHEDRKEYLNKLSAYAARYFFLLHSVQACSGPASRSVSRELKRSRRVGDNSALSSSGVKNAGAIFLFQLTPSWRAA
jgi:hypothetical protein